MLMSCDGPPDRPQLTRLCVALHPPLAAPTTLASTRVFHTESRPAKRGASNLLPVSRARVCTLTRPARW